MAVTSAPTGTPARPAPPSTWSFIRLKLRLMGNGLRGRPWRVVGFVAALLMGLVLAFFAFAGLAATSVVSDDAGRTAACLAGATLVLGWSLVPLLFFGVDETLDPARFALLPLGRMTVARGMLAAAFIGVPALATFLGTVGLVVAAGERFGPLGAGAAAVGVVAGLALCVVASRAITSAFATLLRSRRTRDLAGVIIAVLASSVGWVRFALPSTITAGEVTRLRAVARVVAWTPLGAPYVLSFDVGAGRWAVAAARLALTLAAIGVLLWWWSTTLESAMLGTSSGGTAGRPDRTGAGTDGAVAALVPGTLRRVARPGPFGAIMARETRYWWRDPRRRASLVSILIASVVLPVAINVSRQATDAPSALRFGLVAIACTMSGAMVGLLLGNQFAYDADAYAAHLLATVSGRTELRARAAALAAIAFPAQVLVVAAVTVLGSRAEPTAGLVGQVAAGLGVLGAAMGASLGSSTVLSVLAPYALPANTNPFAMNSGGASAKSVLAFVAMMASFALTAPVAVAATVIGPALPAGLAVMVGGAAAGVLFVWLGTALGGSVLDQRGPEILAAVTPRR